MPNTKFLVQAGWSDAPHLTEEAKKELFASIPEYQRDARTKGIPQLGSGLIYKTPLADITVGDFKLPPHWPRAFGLDVGWNWTAAVWSAWNQETDTVYLWSAYKRGEAEPSVHADAIRARGKTIPGVIDPAAAGSNQLDGRKLIEMYRGLGLDLHPADNAVEAGIYEVWQRLSTGRLKVFESMQEFFYEYSRYQRDERGRVKKNDDHLMDAMRYLILSGLRRAAVEPMPKVGDDLTYSMPMGNTLGWLAG